MALLNRRLHKYAHSKHLQSSRLNNSWLQHLKTSGFCIRQQISDAIRTETGLITQQGFPFFGWKMRLQPESTMDAAHSKLEQSGTIQGLSDQIQGKRNEVNLLCRSGPDQIVRCATKIKSCQRFQRMPNRKR